MRQFSDLSHYQQTMLLVRVVQLVAAGNTYKSIEDVAAARETSPRLLWLNICADEGFAACEPWTGFPGLPEEFYRVPENSINLGVS
jgi:hypothetical protein